MNQNTAGAVLLLIIAAAGLHNNVPAAWWLAGITAALAFVNHEVRALYEVSGRQGLAKAGFVIAFLSWLTVAAAAYSLI
jgi:hypothetical protein